MQREKRMRSMRVHVVMSIAGVLSAVAILTAMDLPRTLVYQGVAVICAGIALQWVALMLARRG